MEIVRRLFTPPKGSFFLFGPRGTGKSLWVSNHCPDALVVNLLEPESFSAYSARPERLRNLIQGLPTRRQVIIDEVQRVPDLLNVVHLLREQRPDLQFILTGSSTRKLKRSGVNLLGGRALLCHLHPFMAAELGDQFRLERALQEGLIPLIWESPEPRIALKAYHALYLREEVQMEALVRNIGHFSRFLEVVSFSHAGVLNVNNVSREAEIGRKTVEGYLDVLEDLLLAFRIPVFTKRAKRALAGHPKFFLFDVGVFRTLRSTGPLDRPQEIEGAALEGLVAQHLRAWIDYRQTDDKLYYWRTRSGVEVDFVVYGPEGLIAIEVKSAAKILPEYLRGLRALKEDYPEAVTILLYKGREQLRRDGIWCLPCDEFLKALHPSRAMTAALS